MKIIDGIRKIVENDGVQIDDNGELINMDSLSFVQIIIDIEIEYSISIPDAFLRDDIYPNLESLEAMVLEVLSQKKQLN